LRVGYDRAFSLNGAFPGSLLAKRRQAWDPKQLNKLSSETAGADSDDRRCPPTPKMLQVITHGRDPLLPQTRIKRASRNVASCRVALTGESARRFANPGCRTFGYLIGHRPVEVIRIERDPVEGRSGRVSNRCAWEATGLITGYRLRCKLIVGRREHTRRIGGKHLGRAQPAEQNMT